MTPLFKGHIKRCAFLLSAAVALSACHDDSDYRTVSKEEFNRLMGEAEAGSTEGLPFNITNTAFGPTLTAKNQTNILVNEGGNLSTATVTWNNWTLYFNEGDTVNTSNCNGDCVTAWPPLLASSNASAQWPYTIVQRDDGNSQWALRGLPLYFFRNDAGANTFSGDANPVWRTAIKQPVIEGAYLRATGNVRVGKPQSGATDSFVGVREDRHLHTLYTFDNDPSNGTPACVDQCLVSWPPLLADEKDTASDPYSLIERPLNAAGATGKQWAYKGKPLYFNVNDLQAGDTNGANAANWQLATPKPWKGLNNLFVGAGRVPTLTTDTAEETASSTQTRAVDGMALYTRTADVAGAASSCEAACAETWPPLLAFDGAKPAGDFTLIARNSGLNQWAYQGKPVYLNINDSERGIASAASAAWPAIPTVSAPPIDEPNDGDTPDNTPAIAFSQVQDIFDANCVGCHGTSGGLSLEAGVAYDNIVNVASNKAGANKDLVEPGDASASYLVDLLKGQGVGGAQMPLTSSLSAADIQLVEQWVNEGALRSPAVAGSVNVDETDTTDTTNNVNPLPSAPSGGNVSLDADGNDDSSNGSGDNGDTAKPEEENNSDNENETNPEDLIDEDMPLLFARSTMGEIVTAKSATAVLAVTGTGLAEVEKDWTGRSLYTFENDDNGQSACVSEGCIENWPPLLASNANKAPWPFSKLQREDGYWQWALRGEPLYFYSGDQQAGDINGEGVGNVWHVALSQATQEVEIDQAGTVLTTNGNVLLGEPLAAGDNTAFVEQRGGLDRNGMSLYTFANDEPGVSNCFGNCLEKWTPLLADTNDSAFAPYSLIDRKMDENGATARQWAYQNRPLYLFDTDTAPGEFNGDSVNNWKLARPLPWKMNLNYTLVGAGLALTASNDADGEVVSAIAKDGFTLYTFDNDSNGEASACENACIDNWPPLIAHSGAVATGKFSLIPRNSGLIQWAFEGKPLYFFANDENIGDTSGDGGVWHAVGLSLGDDDSEAAPEEPPVEGGDEGEAEPEPQEPEEPEVEPAPVFADVQTLIVDRCENCHGDNQPSAGLTLTLDTAYNNIVNQPSNQATDKQLVNPGNADESYLLDKLIGENIGNTNPMPPFGAAFTPEEIDLVRRWIDGGAQQ